MYKIKKHIVFRVFAFMLATMLFVPTIIKFAHVFSHHEHKVCSGDETTHFHQVDLDCDFQKFQLNHPFLLPLENDNWADASFQYQIFTLTYKFLNSHRQLSFSLRGPPVLV
ncbi:hypothetical protein [Algibacter sp. 2305UL17-15]|uniref:hypothetical protein n=1 Tax=Algibacter sp. 2305UL17-15 TaxID=3231268 RepID=UPI0034593299